MKLDETAVKLLVREAVQVAEREEDPLHPEQLIFTLDDMTIIFKRDRAGKPYFFALILELIGREFIIDATYEALLQGLNDEGAEETYQVSHPPLLNRLATYLQWRAGLLQDFHL